MRVVYQLVPRILLGVVAASAVTLLASERTAHAQAQTGAVQGRVLDSATGQPLEGVTVVATSPALQGTQAEVTDDTGFYLIQNLPPGYYEIAFYYGEAQVHQPGVRVLIGGTTPINLKLDSSTMKGESITIVQKAPAIDVGSTKQGTKMDHEFLDNVPQTGRSFEGTIGSAAGAQDDLFGTSFSGSTSVENSYVIDGVNTTGLTFGTVGSTLLTNFIEEIEVITGGYDAEFGRSTGGIVNVITKSGSNEFHGSAWVNYASGALALTPEGVFTAGSSLSADSELRYETDFGFELGGPIIPDRLWFYVGFAPVMQSERVTRRVSAQVDRAGAVDDDPLTNSNVGCELTGSCESDGIPDLAPGSDFPLFEEVDRDDFVVSNSTYQFTGKLNFAVSPDHQGSVALTGSSITGVDLLSVDGTPTATRAQNDGLVTDGAARWMSKFNNNKTEVSVVLGWHRSQNEISPITSTLPDSPGLSTRETPSIEVQNTDLGSVGRNRDKRESDTALRFCTDADPMVADAFPGIQNCPLVSYRYDSLGALQDIEEERYSGKVAVTQRVRFFGHHQLKLGFDGENNFLTDNRSYTGDVFYVGLEDHWEVTRYVGLADSGANVCGFDSETGEPRACDYLDELNVHGQTVSWATFVQDKWDILPNLRLNIGMRYEQQSLKYAEEVQGTVDPVTGGVRGEDAMNLNQLWAPRVGLTYDWTKEGRSKLFASYGRFYEALPMDLNQIAFGAETSYVASYDWAAQCGPAPASAENEPRLPSNPANCPSQPSADAMPIADARLGGSSTLVVPGLQAQRLDEILLGAEYEPFEDITVGVSYQNRAMGRVIEDVSVDGTNTYILANPGEFDEGAEADLQARVDGMSDGPDKDALERQLNDFRKLRLFDKPRRNYNALTLHGRKRFSNNFFVQGSYTFSRLEGNYPGLFSDNNGQLLPNITSQYDLFELLGNRDGRLPADRPHIVKLAGFYRMNLKEAGEVTLGLNARAQSGKPIEVLGSHAWYGGNEVFILPRGAGGRTSFVTQADLRVSWGRKLSQTTFLSVYVDFLNVYNSTTETEVDNVYTIENVNPIVGGGAEDLKHLKRQDESGAETGTPVSKQLNWRNATSYQDSLTARLGLTLSF